MIERRKLSPKRIAYAAVLALGGGLAVMHVFAISGAISAAGQLCADAASEACAQTRRQIPYFAVVLVLSLGMMWIGWRGLKRMRDE